MGLAPIPLIAHPDAVEPQWLTAVLRRAGLIEQAIVEGFETRTVGTGQMGTSVRYALAFDRTEERAPRSIVCKFPSSDPTSRDRACHAELRGRGELLS